MPIAPGLSNFLKNNSDPRASDLGTFEPSLTRQEFAAECDINTIMDRYEKTGSISHVNRNLPMYMDVTALPDLRGSLELFRDASLAFAALPAKVRKEFDNDATKFVDYAQDPQNLAQMREWGLAPEPPPAPAPVAVRVIPDPPEPPAKK